MASGRRPARAGGPPPEPRGVLFRHPPRALRGARAWQIGARTVHIAAMALVLGGVAWRAPARDLVAPMAITALSGVVLLGIDLGKSKVWLFNLWASWCVSCREEHPLLMDLARQNIVPIVGLDYKDKRNDAEAWLSTGGNPYLLNVFDVEGRIGIDYGVTGVPETFVIDKQGVIRYKQIGPVTQESLREKILPLVAELQRK